MLDVGLSISFDGKSYTVRAGDLTAWDTRELRKQVGYSFHGLLAAFTEDPDIDLIAALVWLSKRVDGDRLTKYETVAEDIGYGVFDTLDVADAGQEDVDGDPEESAGSS